MTCQVMLLLLSELYLPAVVSKQLFIYSVNMVMCIHLADNN